MHKVLPSAIVAALTFAPITAIAADSMNMGAPAPMASNSVYQFELAGPVQSHSGTSTISVRLIHVADKKPVVGAVIIASRADMGPIGMANMVGPIKPLGEQPPGIYRFEVANGSVWKEPANWSLSFSAKVQGVSQTVTGSVTVKLTP